ncbi:MAG: hypothetical protein LBB66_04415 [Desulfovibrio sp.]|nr:hypothetical protein [Desulfovibrio sp.]
MKHKVTKDEDQKNFSIFFDIRCLFSSSTTSILENDHENRKIHPLGTLPHYAFSAKKRGIHGALFQLLRESGAGAGPNDQRAAA